MSQQNQTLLSEALLSFSIELHQLLTEQGEPELTAQVPGLMIFDRCRCGDDFCATFYTKPKPEGSFGPDHQVEDGGRVAHHLHHNPKTRWLREEFGFREGIVL